MLTAESLTESSAEGWEMCSPLLVFLGDTEAIQFSPLSASLSVRPLTVTIIAFRIAVTYKNQLQGRRAQLEAWSSLTSVSSTKNKSSFILWNFIYCHKLWFLVIKYCLFFLSQFRLRISEIKDTFNINLMFPLGQRSKDNNYNKIVMSVQF